jgi:endonuclease I
MKIPPLFVLLAAATLHAAPPEGYYANTRNLHGAALRQALHDIIDNHTVLPYSSSSFDTHDALSILDQDPQNPDHVILIYSRRSEPKSNWPNWNREHLWPQSLGIDRALPAYSDLHALRPCDSNVNSARGNAYFDFSSPTAPGYAFPAHPEAPQCSSDSDSWEPPDSVKGDIARAIFYMDLRYDGSSNEPLLVLTENSSQISSSAHYMGKLSTLLKWHRLDPVDDAERARNNRIYQDYQHNRNPFIDHPDWVEAIHLPCLTLTHSQSTPLISWTNSPLTLTLQQAPSLTSTWQTVTTPPLSQAQYQIHAITTTSNAFYRLILP